MAKIQVLPESVTNKIAAGEVVERPASVVKELMENAVDAGATDIRVEIQDGGKKLIRVVDDGAGIEAEDLPLALASHATSKLSSAEDLFAIDTMGFRGEALASIASISRVRIVSRTANSIEGARIESVGGKVSDLEPAASPVGTTVEVHNLFFNVPARRKFLRSAQTEFSHISEAFLRIALARPDLRLSLVHNRRTVYELLPVEDRRQRIAALFGADLADVLLFTKSEDALSVALEVYASPPSYDRGNAKLQYIFLNRRFVRDRSLAHAIAQAYQGLLTVNRYPVVFLFLTCPPSSFDVNVHPTKTEVRFRDARPVYNAVHATLRRLLLEQDLFPGAPEPDTRTPQPSSEAAAKSPPFPDSASLSPDAQRTSVPTESSERDQRILHHISDFVHRRETAPPGPRCTPFAKPPASTSPPRQQETLTQPSSPTHFPSTEPSLDEPTPSPLSNGEGTSSQQGSRAEPSTPVPSGQTRTGRRFFQLHNTYIVLETEDGFLLLDQHALHERILLEQLVGEAEQAGIQRQRLLMPVTVRLAPTEFAAVMELRVALRNVGIEVDEFGPNTVAIQSVPHIVRKAAPEQILRDVLDAWGEGPSPSAPEFQRRLLEIAACRAAIKAGDPLGPSEIEALLDQWHELENRQTCAHGRPLAIRFTLRDIEKQFRRT